MGHSIFTLCYFAGLNSWSMKAVKELYEIKQEEKIGGQDIFYILLLFLGSTTIQLVRKLFPNTNEMVVSPTQGVSRSWEYMSKIWYSRR